MNHYSHLSANKQKEMANRDLFEKTNKAICAKRRTCVYLEYLRTDTEQKVYIVTDNYPNTEIQFIYELISTEKLHHTYSANDFAIIKQIALDIDNTRWIKQVSK